MIIRLFGAAKEVTGSCYSIEDKEKILVDCGMFQGSKDTERKNYENFPFNPKEYSAVLLTHAHLDHSGRIPKLVREGFRGKIYATDATKELAEIIFNDAAKIAKQDTENENERRQKQGLPPRKPIYNEVDVKNAMKLFTIVKYDEEFKIGNMKVKYYDAGHIIGAASIQLEINGKTIVFSGDIGQKTSVLVKKTEAIKKADYVFIESTYGDRLHSLFEEKDFIKIIKESYNKNGKLMIPSFAVERAQEILYLIGKFIREDKIPKMEIYLDSPMAEKATAVFVKYNKYYNENVKKDIKKIGNPFIFPELKITSSVEESKKINSIANCIVVAGNGMCTAGRIKHHIRNGIDNPRNTLLFVGYQAEGTLGYWIKKGEKRIKLLGDEKEVKAKIESIDGFSAHADYKGLIEWLENFSKIKKVYVCHGEEKQAKEFSKKIQKYSSYVPSYGEILNID